MKKKGIIFLFLLAGALPLKVLSQTPGGHLTGQVTMPIQGVPLAFTAHTIISTRPQNKAVVIQKKAAHPPGSSKKRKTLDAGSHPQTEALAILKYSMVRSLIIDSVDLGPFAPPVAEQQYPVCYAYASVYAARTLLYNSTHHITGQPDSTVFSTAFLQKMMCSNTTVCQTTGFDTYKACQILRDSGSVFQKDFKADDCTDSTITPALREKALSYRVNANMIFSPCDSKEKKTDSIKTSLARGLPVIVTWISTDSFNRDGNGVTLWQPDSADYHLNACHDTTDHSFCIIGYNNIKYGGAFLVMNSWGTSWGTDGFMWIRYSDMAYFAASGICLSNRNN